METPDTRYVAVGDADVAYQVVGGGTFDVLNFSGLGSHLDMLWDSPSGTGMLARLASLGRLILFDRRGTGASDGVARNAIPTWEEWTEDVGAVLDAAGSDRAAIFAEQDAGPIAILFAATHPERVSALVLANTSARYLVADDYPAGVSKETADTFIDLISAHWGTPDLIAAAYPDLAMDPELQRWLAKQTRAAATPRTAAAQYRYLLNSVDVRHALPLIRVPTLVLPYNKNPLVPVDQGRFLAENIHGATFVELPGEYASLTSFDVEVWLGDVAEFLTGERPEVGVERILTTVLFTDIVGSTAQAAAVGDRGWRSLLDAHDRNVREQLRRFHGREINTTGDGFVASFDGPARAIRCAQAIAEATGKLAMKLRMGLHTGECEVRGDDLGGLAVHIAARVSTLAAPGEILVSGTIKDLVVGSGIEFRERGEHELKGVPGSWKLYAVEG